MRDSTDMKWRTSTAQSIPAFLAVLLLVIANSSHIHLRYCFDGAEAPISILFGGEETHVSGVAPAENFGTEDQADFESELSLESLLAKLSKTPTDSLAIFAFNLPAISRASITLFQLIGYEILPDKLGTLLPPSRAPPTLD